ncbi:RHS repeat-associated core domain-containing protein, partial [Enterobacter chuandaensis]
LYYGWRYYQPETGRWLSADPGGLIDGVNLFRFCCNNPLNIIDTDGRADRPSDATTSTPGPSGTQINSIPDEVDEAYRHMGTGTKWPVKFTGKKDFETRVANNYEQFSGVKTSAAADFLERFNKLEFKLVHFTPAKIHSGGTATFYSRFDADEKGLLTHKNLDNTGVWDLKGLRTDKFSFFSLGVKGVKGKQSSRFAGYGGYRYTIRMKDAQKSPYFSHAYGAINDTIQFKKRDYNPGRTIELINGDSSLIGTSEDNKDVFNKYFKEKMTKEQRDDISAIRNDDVSDDIMNTVSVINTFQDFLGRHIVKIASNLSPETQARIFNTKSPADFDKLISLLFRPQILVPRKLEVSSFKRKALKD